MNSHFFHRSVRDILRTSSNNRCKHGQFPKALEDLRITFLPRLLQYTETFENGHRREMGLFSNIEAHNLGPSSHVRAVSKNYHDEEYQGLKMIVDLRCR